MVSQSVAGLGCPLFEPHNACWGALKQGTKPTCSHQFKQDIKVIGAVFCWKASLIVWLMNKWSLQLLHAPWSSYSNHPDASSSSFWRNSLQLGNLGEERQTDLTKSTGSNLQHFETSWEEWRKPRAACHSTSNGLGLGEEALLLSQ